MKVDLDVKISLFRVLSTEGRGEASPPNVSSAPPPQKKVFPEKQLKAISNSDLI